MPRLVAHAASSRAGESLGRVSALSGDLGALGVEMRVYGRPPQLERAEGEGGAAAVAFSTLPVPFLGMRLLVAALFALVLAAPSFAADLQGPAHVIDGDTIEVAGQRVRLHGIDAPEADQTCRLGSQEWRCGLVATDQLIEATSGRDVRCEGRDRDRYGRIVAVCFVGDTNLNAWLASEGWALAYRKYSLDYVDEEDRARASRKGLWRDEFIAPWDWRRGVREPANDNVAGKCLIKGNISSKGERIYHIPGGQDYERTKISTAKGERWFCTEAEARAAGWRASKR